MVTDVDIKTAKDFYSKLISNRRFLFYADENSTSTQILNELEIESFIDELESIFLKDKIQTFSFDEDVTDVISFRVAANPELESLYYEYLKYRKDPDRNVVFRSILTEHPEEDDCKLEDILYE